MFRSISRQLLDGGFRGPASRDVPGVREGGDQRCPMFRPSRPDDERRRKRRRDQPVPEREPPTQEPDVSLARDVIVPLSRVRTSRDQCDHETGTPGLRLRFGFGHPQCVSPPKLDPTQNAHQLIDLVSKFGR